MIRQELLWTPRAKQRPRTAFKQGHYRTFTPKETKDAERALASQWMGPPTEGPIGVDMDMWNDHIVVSVYPWAEPTQAKLRRGDIDNYTKLIADALNGRAWADDRQIARLRVEKM